MENHDGVSERTEGVSEIHVWERVELILEAFSQTLRSEANRERRPEEVLHEWLSNILNQPPAPQDHVANVIHTEIAQLNFNGQIYFEGKTPSGRRLLVSLYDYCRSYDHWQFTRWLHELRASDFRPERAP